VRGYRQQRLEEYGARFGMGPAVFTLLIINVGIYVLQFLSGVFANGIDYPGTWLAYRTELAVGQFQIWRFFTYQFLHGSFMHLFFNMLGLWLFGSRLEGLWGTRTFTWYYLISGLGGGLLYGLLTLVGIGADSWMLGASGAVYGILLAFGLAFPDAVILVFFFPMPARIAVIVFGVISLLGAGGVGRSNIAHMAHLGGMITGFLFLWLFTNGHPSRVPQLPRQGGTRSNARTSGSYRTGEGGGYQRGPNRQANLLERLIMSYHRWRTRMRMKVVDSQRDNGGGSRPRPGNGRDYGGQDVTKVDAILEKISREGITSLSDEEKDILRRASKKD
jgi:membrane associated rhomboid family serine protease